MGSMRSTLTETHHILQIQLLLEDHIRFMPDLVIKLAN